MIRNVALVFISAFLMADLALALPKPAKSEYFETTSAGFGVEKDKGLFYGMTYQLIQPLSDAMFGTVIFQNPADKKSPFVVEIVINPGDETVSVQSPVFNGIKNKKNYKVEFELYESEAREKRVNRHVDKVNFSLPSPLAIQMGIELL